MVPNKTYSVGKKTAQFTAKPIISNPTKTVTSVWKTTPILSNIDVQDKDDIAISTDDDEVILTEDEIGNLFQDTFSSEEAETK